MGAKKFIIFFFFLNLLVSQESNGQDTLNFSPPAVSPVVYAVETNETMLVDGKLNETVWQTAPLIKDFFRIEPRQGGTYLYNTEVKILFDKKNLYFGVFCKDSMDRVVVCLIVIMRA